jgi:hypothetical protein
VGPCSGLEAVRGARDHDHRSVCRSFISRWSVNSVVLALPDHGDDEVVAGPRRQADLLTPHVPLGHLEAVAGDQQVLEDGAGRRARGGHSEQPAGRLGGHDHAARPALPQQRAFSASAPAATT